MFIAHLCENLFSFFNFFDFNSEHALSFLSLFLSLGLASDSEICLPPKCWDVPPCPAQ